MTVLSNAPASPRIVTLRQERGREDKRWDMRQRRKSSGRRSAAAPLALAPPTRTLRATLSVPNSQAFNSEVCILIYFGVLFLFPLILGGKLHCTPCQKNISYKNVAKVTKHVSGPRHLGKLQKKEDESKERNRIAYMYRQKQIAATKEKKEVGSGTKTVAVVPGIVLASPSELAWRHRVVIGGIKAGASISTLAMLRPLINDLEGGFGGPGDSTMRQLCGPLRDFERATTINAMEKKWFVLEIDGTPHVGELLGGVTRFADDNYVDTHQRLLAVTHLPKSPDSIVLGRKILELTKRSVFPLPSSPLQDPFLFPLCC